MWINCPTNISNWQTESNKSLQMAVMYFGIPSCNICFIDIVIGYYNTCNSMPLKHWLNIIITVTTYWLHYKNKCKCTITYLQSMPCVQLVIINNMSAPSLLSRIQPIISEASFIMAIIDYWLVFYLFSNNNFVNLSSSRQYLKNQSVIGHI